MLARIDWKPESKTLDQFSQWAMFFLGMVLCPLEVYRGHPRAALVCWLLAAGIRVVGFARPRWLRPVYVGLMLATWPIGVVISYITLAVIYFLVFTPVAVLFRLIGRDVLNRKFDRGAETYWESYKPDRGLARYLRQF
jgi:hypothetical protein